MRYVLAALLLLSVPLSAEDATFSSDLVQHVMTGEKSSTRDVSISLTADALVVTPKKGEPFTIPYSAITSITYDRRSKVRKMAYTISPAIKHYLTVQYPGEVLEIEMGKSVAPNLVAQLEAKSGKHIERTSS